MSLRASYRRPPTLCNTLEGICEDVRVSRFGEADEFILIVHTDERLRIMTYGFDENGRIVDRLFEAVEIVRDFREG